MHLTVGLKAVGVFSELFQIAYKSEYDKEKTEQGEYNYPATITPGYKAQRKLDPLKDVSVHILYLTPTYCISFMGGVLCMLTPLCIL